MSIRTDLAVEQREMVGDCAGVETEKLRFGKIEIDRIHVLNPLGAEKLSKPIGNYVTISFEKFTPEDTEGDLHAAIKSELLSLLPQSRLVLVAGLGNTQITPDALGPKTADGIFATRHVSREMAESVGLHGLKGVESISPGVLGQTGIEAQELIRAAVKETRPDAVIVIDALAARSIKRLGATVQMTDSGICPGSGVGNSRAEISAATLEVPVIAIGVPTVVDAATFAEDMGIKNYNKTESTMMVTARDIDTMIEYAAKTISHAINCALQPEIDGDVLLALNY